MTTETNSLTTIWKKIPGCWYYVLNDTSVIHYIRAFGKKREIFTLPVNTSNRELTKKIIGFVPFHFCFILGDLISDIPWPGPARWFMNTEYGAWTYIPYNKLMSWSVNINDWAGFDYWEKCEDQVKSRQR